MEIVVYVRKTGGGYRITFPRHEINAQEMLEAGIAVDGNQGLVTIDATSDEVRAKGLSGALVERSRSVVAFLEERGYDPRFE